jgi:flagellar motor component MotA
LSKEDFEELFTGLLGIHSSNLFVTAPAEKKIRKQIKELKKYRKLGIHTILEAQEYEEEGKKRVQ